MTAQATVRSKLATTHDRGIDRPAPRVNVGWAERMGSVVAGGALVLAGLKRRSLPGLALAAAGGALLQRGITGRCQCYQALHINTARPHNAAIGVRARHGVRVEKSLLVARPKEEVWQFWRDLTNLPRVMRHLLSVEILDDNWSRWRAKGPLGTIVQWEAELYRQREGEMIAWRSFPGGDVDTAGSVHFHAHDRGTVVRVSIKYDPPGGKAGDALAKIFGRGLGQELQEDLRRFKQLMETGEIATTEGQPAGRN